MSIFLLSFLSFFLLTGIKVKVYNAIHMAERLQEVGLYLQQLAAKNNEGRLSLDSFSEGARVAAGTLDASLLSPSTDARVTPIPGGYELRYNGADLPTDRRFRTSFHHLQVVSDDGGLKLRLFNVDRLNEPDSVLGPDKPESVETEYATTRLPFGTPVSVITRQIGELMDEYAPMQPAGGAPRR